MNNTALQIKQLQHKILQLLRNKPTSKSMQEKNLKEIDQLRKEKLELEISEIKRKASNE